MESDIQEVEVRLINESKIKRLLGNNDCIINIRGISADVFCCRYKDKSGNECIGYEYDTLVKINNNIYCIKNSDYRVLKNELKKKGDETNGIF